MKCPLWQANDARMTQWALILTEQRTWFEGGHMCILCGVHVCTHLLHKMAHTSRSLPPVKKRPSNRSLGKRVRKKSGLAKEGATPPVQLGLSGRNSRKLPERPRKRSQSVSWNSPREYGWDPPKPLIQGIWGFQSISKILSPPPVRLGTLFFQKSFRRGPLRAGHGIPSSTGGISDKEGAS